MSDVSEVMDQEERVLEEVSELGDYIRELRGYLNELDGMVNAMTPNHWDGGDRLDQAFLDSLKSEVDNVVSTANDFSYDVGQIESHTDRLLGAIEDLEGLKDEEEDDE